MLRNLTCKALLRVGLLMSSSLVLVTSSLYGQSWTNIPKSATTFKSYTGSGQTTDPYYSFYLPFPASTAVMPDSGCTSPNTNTQYQWWRYLALDNTSPSPPSPRIWSGPISTFLRDPGQLFITNESYYLNGLQYAGALGGKIISNSDPNSPPSDSLSEAVFVHQRPCYDGGPEFGFYRNIQTPSDFPNTIYFYYSDITNCTGHAFGYQNNYPNGTVVNPPQSSCYDPSTATFISNILPSQGGGKGVQIAAPTGQNSIGHYDWLYQAYVTGPSQFTVVVSDPYNSIQQSSVIVTVDPFFESYTSQMWNNGQGSQFWGYVTVAMNKKLDRDQNSNNRGDLTLNPFDFPAVGLTSLAVRQ